MFSPTQVSYYKTLFVDTFADRRAEDVTPFVMPDLPNHGEVEIYTPTHGERIVPIKEVGDWLNLERRPLYTAVDVATVGMVKMLAYRAAGLYHAFALGAVKKYGSRAALACKLSAFHIVENDQPNVADPACVIPGWVSYRMRYASCSQEWLAYVLPVKK